MKTEVCKLYSYSTQLSGTLEDIDIMEVAPSTRQLRVALYDLAELAESIRKVGLLQPIIVRTNNSNGFEVVAGNRRLSACRKLGWKKIACNLVEMDDKQAFEASIIENVQRNTLDPIEEGMAYSKYVKEFGWGGVSDLAKKLSKSTSYISKRVKLTELPSDITELISESEIKVSTGEELLQMKDKDSQSMLIELIQERQLSSRAVRKLVKVIGNKKMDEDLLHHYTEIGEYEKIRRIFDKLIISIRIIIKKLVAIIETVEDKWILYDTLMQHKHFLHEQIDLLIKERRKYTKNSHMLHRSYA